MVQVGPEAPDPRRDNCGAVLTGRPGSLPRVLDGRFADPLDGPPLVVLGGAANAVSAARSLGRRGVAVHALVAPSSPARWSRYVRTYVPVSGPSVQEQMLERLAAGPREGVILPCDDEALELIARRRPVLDHLGYQAVEADDDVVLAMLDKSRTYALASQHGVPAPRAYIADDADALEALADRIGFPLALKPVHAHHFARRRPRVKAVVVRDTRELHTEHAALAAAGLRVMVTEIIPGPEDAFCSYYSFLDAHGAPLLHFNRHKLRQFPPGFGAACYATNRIDPDASRLGLRFLQAVGLRGIGNVEFKRDARDGQLKLIECNPRLTAGDRHLQLCGVDLPLLAYSRTVGLPLPPVRTRRTGVHIWHPVEDARAFLSGRDGGGPTLREWSASLLAPQHFPVASLADPRPTIGFHAVLAARVISEKARSIPPWKGTYGEGLQLRSRRAPRALPGGGLAVPPARRRLRLLGVPPRVRQPFVRRPPGERQGDRRAEGSGAARFPVGT
jgi:predicted ATP-grasp superfamily ATP-dependent carboligase